MLNVNFSLINVTSSCILYSPEVTFCVRARNFSILPSQRACISRDDFLYTVDVLEYVS